ncbi:MAG: amidohydrolase [Actinomycetales bacterium]|nr:amidohydrolase [Actinomycetales bacterium]
MTLTLLNARIPGERSLIGSLINVVIENGVIRDIDFVGATGVISLTEVEGETIDLGGRYIVPGLWDNHVHFSNWSQARRRVDVSASNSLEQIVSLVGEWVAAGRGPFLGAKFLANLWPVQPHFSQLDAVSGDTPVYVLSADLHSAWLNSAALKLQGKEGHATGYLVEQDAFDVMMALGNVSEADGDEWAAEAAREAASRGIVGIVDFEMDWNVATWRRRIGKGITQLRVEFGIYTSDIDRAIEMGLRTGDTIASTDGLLRVGSHKIISDGSLGSRTAFCFAEYPGMSGQPHSHGILNVPYSDLVGIMAKSWAAGISLAVHAIGDRANTLALDAFEAVRCEGSIEHAQLLTYADISRFAKLDVVASVQPEHAMDDRDSADILWAGRTAGAFPFRDMLNAGVHLAFGSDAPVTPLDPWLAIASAVERTRDGLPPWHPEQRIAPEAALVASSRSRIAVGEPADIAILEYDPLLSSVDELRNMPVAATFVAGRPTHLAL